MSIGQASHSLTSGMPRVRPLGWAVAVGLVAALGSAWAQAPRIDKSGAEVVEKACVKCHATGEKNAPRIGDSKAWAPRAALGLSALTAHALTGIRNMPDHGGSPDLSDIEIERAITVMVNRSGGRWIEPLGGLTPATLRSHEQIVQKHCASCHREGKDGAPKIGDRAAWSQRLKKGLDVIVKSAMHGHGAMPAKGGVADLTEPELQGAVMAMFNEGLVMTQSPPVPRPQRFDPMHRSVGGAEVYLGVMRADVAAVSPGLSKAPAGKGQFHVNISVIDSVTQTPVTNAQVKVKVGDALGGESRELDIVTINNMVSYGGWFKMAGTGPYTITAQIQRPGVTGVIETQFDYRVRP